MPGATDTGEFEDRLSFECPRCGRRLAHFEPACPACGQDLARVFSATLTPGATRLRRVVATALLVVVVLGLIAGVWLVVAAAPQ